MIVLGFEGSKFHVLHSTFFSDHLRSYAQYCCFAVKYHRLFSFCQTLKLELQSKDDGVLIRLILA